MQKAKSYNILLSTLQNSDFFPQYKGSEKGKTQTQRRPGEDRARDWSFEPQTENALEPSKAGGGKEASSPGACRRVQPSPHLDFRPLVSRTEENKCLLF